MRYYLLLYDVIISEIFCKMLYVGSYLYDVIINEILSVRQAIIVNIKRDERSGFSVLRMI